MFTILIGLQIFTDTIYTMLSPFLWIYDVVAGPGSSMWTYDDIVIQLYFMSNTLFALFMLYALNFFQLIKKKPGDPYTITDALEQLKDTADSDENLNQLAISSKTKKSNSPMTGQENKEVISEAMLTLYMGLRK